MYNCSICEKSFSNGRAFHCHLLRFHETEYKVVNYRKEVFDKSLKADEPKKEKVNSKLRPTGLRPLSKNDELEQKAAAAGYKFVDAEENLYTLEEAKINSWI